MSPVKNYNGLYLGKHPARKGAVKLRLSDYVDIPGIKLPNHFGHETENINYDMLSNDLCGCCVISDIAHQIMIQAQATRRPVPTFNNTVLPIYSAITGYNANAPLDKNGDNPTDQGTDAAVAANWWQTKGIQDDQGSLHHSKAFGEIAVGDWDQLLKSIYLFGGASIGVQLPSTAASQFDAGQVWTVPSGRVDSLGGHMITGVGLNSKGNLVAITWGKTTAITRDWLERFMDEGVVSMSLEYITATGKSPELFDVIQLTTDLDTLTKR